MDREDILKMAREAGLNSWVIPPEYAVRQWIRFATLVAAKAAQDERSACAYTCELMFDEYPLDIAWAIRARGQ